MRRGAFRQALESFKRAASADSSDQEALQWVGAAEQMLCRYGEAEATPKGALVRFPGYAPLYEAYGKLLLDPGAPPHPDARARAAALLVKALALDDSLPDSHWALGKLLLEDGKPTAALPHLEAAVKLDPRSSRMHLALADAYRALGRAEDRSRELRLYRETVVQEQTRE